MLTLLHIQFFYDNPIKQNKMHKLTDPKPRLITLSIGDNTVDWSRHSTDACPPAHTDNIDVVNAVDCFATWKWCTESQTNQINLTEGTTPAVTDCNINQLHSHGICCYSVRVTFVSSLVTLSKNIGWIPWPAVTMPSLLCSLLHVVITVSHRSHNTKRPWVGRKLPSKS